MSVGGDSETRLGAERMSGIERKPDMASEAT